MNTFYLGTHIAHWLGDARFVDVPLFVSRRTLAARKTLPRTGGRWALDSGGFTELQMYGRWTLTAAEYIAEVRRFRDEIGGMDWAAPMDEMCERQIICGLVERAKTPTCTECLRRSESKQIRCTGRNIEDSRPMFACECGHVFGAKRAPSIDPVAWRAWAGNAGSVMAESVLQYDALGPEAEVIFHGTGLSVEEHQRHTVDNFLELRRLAPELPIIPVIQGWAVQDYWRCVDMYERAGVRLTNEPTVGVGSVCRRQGTREAKMIMSTLRAKGLRLHGFGFKVLGVRASAIDLNSADSLAWSDAARYDAPMPGHDLPGDGRRTGHKNCANCADYALAWRSRMLAGMAARASFGPMFAGVA